MNAITRIRISGLVPGPRARGLLVYLSFVGLALAYFLLPMISDGGDSAKVLARIYSRHSEDIDQLRRAASAQISVTFRATASGAAPANNQPQSFEWTPVDPIIPPPQLSKVFSIDPLRDAVINALAQKGHFEPPSYTTPTKDGQVASGYYKFSSPDLSLSTVFIRWDRLILGLGVALAVGLTVFWGIPGRRPKDSNLASERADESSPVSVLRAHVLFIETRASALYARSTLLLTVGVLMAFMGIGVFYFSLPHFEELAASRVSYPFAVAGPIGPAGGPSPQVPQDAQLQRWPSASEIFWSNFAPSLPAVLRSAGVLLFIEAVAWFLLRQFRSLIEDYKQFTRIYLKRANYLAAFVLLSDTNAKPEARLIAAALIQEDLSGVLRSGETLEAIEKEKIDDKNPVLAIISSWLKRSATDAAAATKAKAVSDSTL
jgi:hypothetical protein